MGGEKMKKAIQRTTVAVTIICTLLLGIGALIYIYMPTNYNTSFGEKATIAIAGLSINENNEEITDVNSTFGESGSEATLMLGNIIPIKNVNINETERKY